MKIKFNYGDKSFLLQPYNTLLEKELLIMDSFENHDLKLALELLGLKHDEVKDLTVKEQIAIMFKLRSISVGEEIAVKYKCSSCGSPNETSINCDDNVIEPKTDIKIKQLFKEVTEDNLQDFVDDDIDELDINEFNELIEKVKDSVIRFDFNKQSNCINCKAINVIDISDQKKTLQYMSDDSLISLYQTYSDLVFMGNYSKLDVDSMLPFERTIFIGLLNKAREELNT